MIKVYLIDWLVNCALVMLQFPRTETFSILSCALLKPNNALRPKERWNVSRDFS